MPPPRHITKAETLRGLVERVVFHNEENDYCILKIVPDGKTGTVSLIGKAPRVVAGEEFEARGVWEPNRDFGPQFKADDLKLKRPDSLGGIERYLGSGLIKGIGPAHAKRIVEKFGPKVFDIIVYESKKLEDVEGVGKKRRLEIRESWMKQKALHSIMLFLHQHGISSNVGLVANDDTETYAAIIALWLEGKCYVPVNPETPAERNRNVLIQAGATVVIDSSEQPLFPEMAVIRSKQLLFTKMSLKPVEVSDVHLPIYFLHQEQPGCLKVCPSQGQILQDL